MRKFAWIGCFAILIALCIYFHRDWMKLSSEIAIWLPLILVTVTVAIAAAISYPFLHHIKRPGSDFDSFVSYYYELRILWLRTSVITAIAYYFFILVSAICTLTLAYFFANVTVSSPAGSILATMAFICTFGVFVVRPNVMSVRYRAAYLRINSAILEAEQTIADALIDADDNRELQKDILKKLANAVNDGEAEIRDGFTF